MYSRTATCIAQTAAGCDFVSDGRFILGLGASGPQVIEGFHGVAVRASRCRASATTSTSCRMTLAARAGRVRRPDGARSRCPAGEGTGLGKPLKLINHPMRADIPIFWASLMGQSVDRAPRSYADGWLPVFFDPEKFQRRVGRRAQGRARRARPGARASCRSRPAGWWRSATSTPATAPTALLDLARPMMALYVGGMGARDKNFYNTICQKYGYVDEAIDDPGPLPRRPQGRGGGRRAPAAARGHQPRRQPGRGGRALAAYREAGVTHLQVTPVAPDPVATIAAAARARRLSGCRLAVGRKGRSALAPEGCVAHARAQ